MWNLNLMLNHYIVYKKRFRMMTVCLAHVLYTPFALRTSVFVEQGSSQRILYEYDRFIFSEYPTCSFQLKSVSKEDLFGNDIVPVFFLHHWEGSWFRIAFFVARGVQLHLRAMTYTGDSNARSSRPRICDCMSNAAVVQLKELGG